MAQIIHTHLMDREAPMDPDEQAQVYNGLDCCITHEVYSGLKKSADETSDAIYRLSFALQIPTIEASLRGMAVDLVYRDKLLAQNRKDSFIIESHFNKLCSLGLSGLFNYRSPKQLKDLFYSDAFLACTPIKKRNQKGQYILSVDEKALLQCKLHLTAQPFVNHILALRSMKKETDFLETPLTPDKRFPTSYNVVGTNSGRMSSAASDFGEGTNAQNIKRELKRIIVADEGMKLGNVDLAQADSRNFGANCWTHLGPTHGWDFAGKYLDACESGDLHTTVAKMVWPTELPWGTLSDREIAEGTIFYKEDSYRQVSKKTGHGTNYYGKPPQVSLETMIPIAMVKEFQERYFNNFPCIPALQQWAINELRLGCLTNLFNRRRYFYGRSTDKNVQNEAIAFLGQSCTADQVNYGMLNVWALNRVQILAQVHDSLFFQFPEKDEDEIMPLIAEAMTIRLLLLNDREFIVPVDLETGWNWGKYNDKSSRGKLNPDGMKSWSDHDTRSRTVSKPGSRFTVKNLLKHRV